MVIELTSLAAVQLYVIAITEGFFHGAALVIVLGSHNSHGRSGDKGRPFPFLCPGWESRVAHVAAHGPQAAMLAISGEHGLGNVETLSESAARTTRVDARG